MKQFAKAFLFRGLVSAAGGPVILAIIYGILGATGEITYLTPGEVCLGIITIALLAFVAAGLTTIYQLEKLPLLSAILIHGAGLYVTYILIYLITGWLQQQLTAILVFTGIFVGGYAVIWIIIYTFNRISARKLTQKLHAEE